MGLRGGGANRASRDHRRPTLCASLCVRILRDMHTFGTGYVGKKQNPKVGLFCSHFFGVQAANAAMESRKWSRAAVVRAVFLALAAATVASCFTAAVVLLARASAIDPSDSSPAANTPSIQITPPGFAATRRHTTALHATALPPPPPPPPISKLRSLYLIRHGEASKARKNAHCSSNYYFLTLASAHRIPDPAKTQQTTTYSRRWGGSRRPRWRRGYAKACG